MRKIYKFHINQAIKVSKDYKFLHFGKQRGDLCVWLDTDTEAEQHEVTMFVIGTGFETPKNATYLGTDVGTTFVWHLYGNKL